MFRKRKVLIGVLILAVLVFGWYHVFLDWSGRPYCHKQIMVGLTLCAEEQGLNINSHTNPFPNVGGLSSISLATIHKHMGGRMDWTKDYNYIPGLQESDPGHLILMYVNRPTRWTWHGKPPTVFEEKAWVIVPVDFCLRSRQASGRGESSERIPTDEFRRRLRETISFIQTNARPGWQTVVVEHTHFLESLGSQR